MRLFNVYGPRVRTSGSYGAVFGVFMAQLVNNKPLTLVAGEKGIGLQQFLFTADMALSYSIKHSAITLIHKTRSEFADAYTKQTSSIVQAPAGMADMVRK